MLPTLAGRSPGGATRGAAAPVKETSMRTTLVLAAVLGLGLLSAGSASAAGGPGSGADFGAHVSEGAGTMGFDGVHNPGMHEGRAGWMPGEPMP